MAAVGSVLIIQTAFIGDVILATGLVESIHNRYPEAAIDFVVRNGNEELLQGNPCLRNVLVLDKKRKYASLFSLISRLRKDRYDAVINVQRFATTGMLTVFSGARITIGFGKNPLSIFFSRRVEHRTDGCHEVERNHALLAELDVKERIRPRLYPSTKQFEDVIQYQSKPYVTVAPASVWFTKQWPVSKWVELLSGLNMRILLLGAQGDSEVCTSIITALPGKDIANLAGKLSLLESAALMSGARMNYVNDSAPMHLASAMNAPVTAIFCSTVPSFGFGPLSDRSHIVETKETLTCRPCGLHGYRTCPEGHFKCALHISPGQFEVAS